MATSAGPAVAGPGDVDRVEVARADHAVQVRVEEVQPGVVPQWPSSRGLTCSGAAARAAAGCRAGRSGRPRGSSPRASRRAAPRAQTRTTGRMELSGRGYRLTRKLTWRGACQARLPAAGGRPAKPVPCLLAMSDLYAARPEGAAEQPGPSSQKIRIVLADDHAVVRSGLRLLLDGERTSRSWPRPATSTAPGATCAGTTRRCSCST